MKFGVFTVMLPDLTPEAAVAALRATGYDGVEWRVATVPANVRNDPPSFWGNNLCTLAPTPADAQRGRALAADAGLAIPNLGTYIVVGDLPAVANAMQLAVTAGAPAVRVGVARNDQPGNVDALFTQSRAFLQEVETLSRRHHVKALIEMHHGTIAASASAARHLVDGLDPTCIGVIHDCGNMVFEGYEDYRRGLETLGPYLAHVHVKNAAYDRPAIGGVWRARWAPLQDGVVDFAALFAALRSVGYDGWVVVEDFSQAYDSRTALRENLTFLRRVYNAAQ
ncbi:MAG TPA: sugar phosphate isomerase/epimerase [Chloroflexi bacterium]|nr:sugar phosphate isomerase/epimerase [Chloroflexota bacterium]HHW89015.1 sugar phosphate isomerase/epimerase [Chloroflexota bacterium]